MEEMNGGKWPHLLRGKEKKDQVYDVGAKCAEKKKMCCAKERKMRRKMLESCEK